MGLWAYGLMGLWAYGLMGYGLMGYRLWAMGYGLWAMGYYWSIIKPCGHGNDDIYAGSF